MLHIDRMRMHLPSGFEHRASSIANLVGKSLAGYTPVESRKMDRLTINSLQVSAYSTDNEIAQRIAERIILSLGEAV